VATLIEQELITQPACWRRAVDEADAQRPALPQPGERVAVIGCGTSLYVAKAYAALRERRAGGETDAFPASEYAFGRRYDRLVAVSRSGTTTEVLDVLRALDPTTRTTAITSVGDAPLTTLTTDAITLTFAAERSIVQTRFPTSVLAMLRAGLGDSLEHVIGDAETAVRSPLPVDPIKHSQYTFLGLGWAAALAEEAALKCREAAGAWTEAYPAMEYHHGPISVSGPGTVVWVLGAVPDRLAEEVTALGARFVASPLDPMAELIRAQRTAVALAANNGRNPDRPRALTFSVVRDSSPGLTR
jgi:fructoselysine-6-P-deglycase FrlB-like protein